MAGFNPWETPFNESGFRAWAARFGVDPDDPEYDWRRAYASGAKPDEGGNWSSQYKRKPASHEEPPSVLSVAKDTLVGALEDLKKIPSDVGGSLMAGLAQLPGTGVRAAEGAATGASMVPRPDELAESLRRKAAQSASVPLGMPDLQRDPRAQLLGPPKEQLLAEAGSTLSANLRAPGERAAEQWAPEQADWRSRPVNAAAQAVGSAIPSLGAATLGAAAGGPAGALAASAPLIFGSSYGEAVDRGVDPETAFRKAVAETAISSPLEAVGGTLAHQALRGGGGLVQALRALAEGGEELAQEEVGMGLERATGASITPERANARRFQALAGGVGAGGLAAGVGSVANRGDTTRLPDATIPQPPQLPDALVPGGATGEALLSTLRPTLRDQDLPPWAQLSDLDGGLDAAVEKIQARQEGAARFGQPTQFYQELTGEEGGQRVREELLGTLEKKVSALGHDPEAGERSPAGESLESLEPRNLVEFMQRFGDRGGQPDPRGDASLDESMARLDKEVENRPLQPAPTAEEIEAARLKRAPQKTLAEYLARAGVATEPRPAALAPQSQGPKPNPLLPNWLQGEEGAVRVPNPPKGPTRLDLSPEQEAQAAARRNKYFGKLPEPEKQSAKDWFVDKADRAYQALFHSLSPPEAAVKRAMLGGVEPFRHAGPLQDRIADLTRFTQTGHGFRTSPIFSATRVFSDFAAPVREFYEGLGETLPDAPPGDLIDTGEPAAAIFHGWNDQTEADMMEYMAYRRHLELAQRKLAGDDLKVDDAATKDAREAVQEIQGRYPDLDLEAEASRLTLWERKATLEPLIEVGVISPEEGVAIVQKNLKHAPFLRMEAVLGKERLQQLQEEGAIPHGQTSAPRVHRIHGGLSSEEGMQLDPRMFENMMQRAVSLQSFAARQRLRNEMVSLAESWLDLGIEKAPEGVTTGTFKRWKNGEMEQWDGPPRLTKALEGASSKERSLAYRLLSGPVAVLRAGVTAGPKFMLKQLLGDPVNGYIQDPNARWSNLSPLQWAFEGRKPTSADLKSNPFRPYIEAAGGVYEVVTGGEDYREMISGGVGDALLVALDHIKPDNLMELARTAHKTADSGYVESFLTQYVQAIKKSTFGLPAIMFPLQQLSGIQDMSSRVAAYKRAKAAGKSKFEGFRNASESTLNFSRGGELVKQANGWQAFLNPQFLDVDKFARATIRDPKNTVLKAITLITLPHVAEWLMWHDDDDYKEQPEWKRTAFYYIGKRDSGGFYLWPKPLGLPMLLFGHATTKLLDAAFDKDPDAIPRLIEATHEGTPLRLLPVQGLMQGRLPTLTDLTNTAMEWSPTATTPLFEAGLNKRIQFNRGAPVVPNWLESGVDTEEVQPWTPHAYQWLGEQTGSSPEKLRHVGEGYTGYVGKMVNRGLDWALESQGKAEKKTGLRPSDPSDSLIYGGFFARPAGQQATSIQEWYDAISQYDEQLKSARRNYDLKEPMQLFLARKKYPLVAKKDSFEAGRKELYKLSSERRKAMDNGEWAKVDKLDAKMANVARLRLRMISPRP